MSLSRNPAPVQRNASPFLHDIPLLCKSQWNSGANWHATRPWKVTFWSSPQRQGHRSRIRTLANGCGRLRTVVNGCGRLRTVANGCEHKNNDRRTQLYPQTPKVKREPFATHSGKMLCRISLKQCALNLFCFGDSWSIDLCTSTLRFHSATLQVHIMMACPRELSKGPPLFLDQYFKSVWKNSFKGLHYCDIKNPPMRLSLQKAQCRTLGWLRHQSEWHPG